MMIDLTKEEWEFLKRVCTRAVAFAEMQDVGFHVKQDDYYKAKALMKKFLVEGIE